MEGTFNTTSLNTQRGLHWRPQPTSTLPSETTGDPQREVAGRARTPSCQEFDRHTPTAEGARPQRTGLVTHAKRRHEALHHSVRLVASGLRRVDAICNVLQGCREKSFNSLRVLTCGRELLICGLWVHSHPLTIDSKRLSDIDHPIHGDHNLLVVGSTSPG
jgi:hypothetical protein